MKSLHPLDSTLTEFRKDEVNFNLERYFQAVLDNKWRIALFVLTVLIASYLIISSLTPQYKATATVHIEKKESQVVDVQSLYGLDNDSEEYLATEFEVMRSRPLAEKVVNKLSLTTHPDFQEKESFSDRIPGLGSLQDKILARDVANTHAAAYIEADLEARLERTKTAASWLAGQVELLQGDLTAAEQSLADYVEQEGVIDLEDIQDLNSQELKDLKTDLVRASAKLSEAAIARDQMQKARQAGNAEALPQVQQDNVAQTLKVDVVEAQKRRSEASKRYGPQHPTMLAATSDLNTARAGLRSQVNRIMETINLEYNAALAEEGEINRRIALAEAKFFSTNRKGSKYLELQREVESNKRLFDLFYNRAKETTETVDLQSAHARILTPAEDPLQPSKPKKAVLFLLAALGSLLLSVLYYIMRELFNTGIRDGEDVDQRIGLPLLGSLPSIKKGFVRPVVLNSQDEADRSREGAIFKEAVNTVRTGLMLDRVDRPHSTIMVTSTIAGEGKSTIAGHLAYSYANVGRTLLIDCDLRTRGVSSMFGVNKTDMGLREVLSAEALLEQCVIGIDNNLDLLCANFTPLNPLKLISSPRFQSHIKEAAKKYNYVILDAPPVLPVSDPLVLAGYVDAVVYAIRARSTPFQHISRCMQSLQRVEAPVVGVVLNQLEMGGTYYSYYSYGNT